MCGIAGIFDTRHLSVVDSATLAGMNQALFHRGPDEGGVFIDKGIGLAHRRLSIIDISTGQQPLFNNDKSVGVIFNGEIYNFRELTEELSALGYAFRTHSDTEVIVHAWQAWGQQCVTRFRGMFAFAIWDSNQQTVFLARDRLGIKPLYYAELNDGTIIFGSELKALLIHPALPRELDPYAVEDYFAYGYIPEPRTIFKYCLKLPPAHTLLLQRGKPVPPPQPYWDIPFVANPPASEADIAAELIERLREAVKIRLIAEVPLGAFLSGGVDSSAIVAMMAELSNEPVNTSSIAFGDRAFNEAEYAQQIAARYHTNHQTQEVAADDFSLLDKLAQLYDEPYADSSAIPTYRVCELAKKRVTVALSGDGGDENFAGYRRYRWHLYEEQMRGMLPLSLRKPLFGFMGNLYPKADWAPKSLRAKATLEALARDPIEGYFHSVSILGDKLRGEMFSPAFKRELQNYGAIEVLRTHASNAPSDALSRVQYLDMKTYLVGDILTKVDRASMAHALEVRVPLLDHKLVEWISGLPPALKLKGQEGKYIFKKSLENYLPSEILYRPKMGFAVPLASWFRGPLQERVKSAVLGPVLADTGIFNMGFLQQMVSQHQSGRRDNSAPLWSLLMFESFLRNVLKETAPESLRA